jgi:hypothetical protein
MSETITYSDGSIWEKLVRDDTKIGASNVKVANWPTFDYGLQTQANTANVYRSFDNYPNAFAISNKEGKQLFGFFPDYKVEYNLQENIPLNSEDLYVSISKKLVNPILGFGKKKTEYTYSKSDGETYVETCTDDDHCTFNGDSKVISRIKSPLSSPSKPTPSGVAARLFGTPAVGAPAVGAKPKSPNTGSAGFGLVNPAFGRGQTTGQAAGGYRKRKSRHLRKQSTRKQRKHARK